MPLYGTPPDRGHTAGGPAVAFTRGRPRAGGWCGARAGAVVVTGRASPGVGPTTSIDGSIASSSVGCEPRRQASSTACSNRASNARLTGLLSALEEYAEPQPLSSGKSEELPQRGLHGLR
jgi:hypothetical protein